MRTIITTTGTSLQSNAARELGKKFNEVTEAELRHLFEQVGIEAACAETNSLFKPIVTMKYFYHLLDKFYGVELINKKNLQK